MSVEDGWEALQRLVAEHPEDAVSVERWCKCLGVVPGMPTRCEREMTQEDMLCDPCRTMCHGPLGEERRREFMYAQRAIEEGLGRPMRMPFFPDGVE